MSAGLSSLRACAGRGAAARPTRLRLTPPSYRRSRRPQLHHHRLRDRGRKPTRGDHGDDCAIGRPVMGFTGRVAHAAYVVGLCASLGATCGAAAQLPPVVVPPNAVLPNYERIPLAGRESIEAGAFVARTNDAAANWYNPAGLAQHKESAVNASATAYEWTRMRLAGPGVATDR